MNIKNGEVFVVKKIQLVHSYHGLDQNKVKALKQEIDQYKYLNHPNIVKYLGCENSQNNTFFIYLEYVQSGSIEDIYKKFGHLTETTCKQFTKQILAALNYLHS